MFKVPSKNSTDNSIIKTSRQLDDWIESQNFLGWDPFDALNSPIVKWLTFRNQRLGQIWVQAIKRCPINLRPLLGVQKGINPKAMGLFLASYWRKYLMSQNSNDYDRCFEFADWLENHPSPGFHGNCWGYNFDWPNRSFYAVAGTPTVVNTAFNGLAFLDLITLPDPWGLNSWGERPLRVARSACEFILRDLNVERVKQNEIYFSYTPIDHRCIHNANLLAAWLLAEVGSITGERELICSALEAARFSVKHQKPDGSWPYGEGAHEAWVDNFHTGYVLVALKHIGERLRTEEFNQALDLGYAFWKNNLFLQDGTPKSTYRQVYPIDTHCVAMAILSFLAFRDRDPKALEKAYQEAGWGIQHLFNPRGYFNYQKGYFFQVMIPYLRWTQAWMQRALTELLFMQSQMDNANEPG